METKEHLDQNPEEAEKAKQEENSKAEVKPQNVKEKETSEQPETESEPKTKKKPGRKKKTEAEKTTVAKNTTKKATAKKKTEEAKASLEADKSDESSDKSPADKHSEGEEKGGVIPDLSEPEESKEEKPVEGQEKEDVADQPVMEGKKSQEETAIVNLESSEDSDEEEEEEDESESHEEETVRYNEMSREELVALLEETVKDGKIEEIKKRVALIKVAFLKLNKEEQHLKYERYLEQGGDKEEFEPTEDSLEQRFNNAFAIYRNNRQVYLENLEQEKQHNLEAKKIILEELKALIDSEESLKKTYDEFRELQDKWKEIGMVPKNEVNNLWQNYHFLVEKFFDKVKINKELRDLDLKKNLESKIELCEKAEELLLENSIIKSFKQLQSYHEKWKEIGPVPQDKKDEIWERFKSATEKINQRRRDHYNQLQEVQKNNLVAKSALCEKAEEILQLENNSIKDWQANTDKITELLKVWKTIGPAPRKQNDEIWDRFKTSLDTFFSGKKEYFQQIKDEQINNYNLKIDICAQAEALKSSTDWRKTTQDLINLQKEWKKIGPVPRKHSDKIWKRFRAACDEFFNNKSEYFANIGKHEKENQKQKEQLVQEVVNHAFKGNKSQNLDVLKDFQRRWTEIGHVPIKEKDRLQNEFRSAINSKLDELKISQAEIQTVNYKQRIENISENPNARRIINNERNTLINKKKKLEEEINLWENNIGFLAQSKKADLLKQEFEKKIDNAKKDLEVLNEKIHVLNEKMD
jgi:hypothetical protein